MMRNPVTHFIIALVLLAIVCGGYTLWYGKVEAKSAELETLKTEIQSKTQDAQRSQQAKQELSKLNVDEAAVGQYFISTNDVVPFLEQLAQTGQFLGSKVEVVSVSANPGTPYGTLQLSIKVTGSFDAVLRTMGAIEYGPYGTSVTSFTLSAGSTNAKTAADQVWTATAMVNVGTETNGSAANSSIVAPTASTTQSAPATPAQTPAPTPTQKPTPPGNASGATATP